MGETQTVVDVTYTQECQDIVRQVCTETRVAVQTHSAIVGHAVAAAPQVIPQLQAGIVPQAIDGVLAQRLVKRDADAEADADADAQFFGINPLLGAAVAPARQVVAAVAPAAVPAAAVVPAAAPAACQAVTERQCRQVPVEVPRQLLCPGV